MVHFYLTIYMCSKNVYLTLLFKTSNEIAFGDLLGAQGQNKSQFVSLFVAFYT